MKVLFCFCVFFGILLLEGCGHMPKDDFMETIPTADQCFRLVFGQSPPPTVTSLQAEGTGFRDYNIHLRFHVSKTALSALTGPHVNVISRNNFRLNSSPYAAKWWKPLTGRHTVFMESNISMHPNFGQGSTYLSYDPDTQTACVWSQAWD